MTSSPITHTSLEAGQFGEIREVTSIAVDTLRRYQEGSRYLRYRVDQLTLMEGSSLLGLANLEVRGMHLAMSILPL